MRKELLEILRCPSCKDVLTLEVYEEIEYVPTFWADAEIHPTLRRQLSVISRLGIAVHTDPAHPSLNV